MPLTPPPRRAPAPHTVTFGCTVSTPQVPTSSGRSRPRPLQRPVEDVAARQAEVPLEVGRRPHLDAGVAVGVTRQDVVQRLVEHRVQCAEHRPRRLLAPDRLPRSSSARGTGGPGSAARRGSASARRRRRGRGRGCCGRTGCGSTTSHGANGGIRPLAATACASWRWAMPSCTCRVPAKATRGSTVRSFRRGSRVSRRLTFSWAPSGGGSSPETGADVRGGEQRRPAAPAPGRRGRGRGPAAHGRRAARRPRRPRRPRRRPRPVTSSAPAPTAAFASASVTAPMPPTGTSQSPVPPPIRW